MPKLSDDEIRERVAALGPWFHNLDLNGVKTAPDHFLGDYPAVKWRHFADAIPADLSGKSVLDVGCNAGFYSLEMKRRGAARVLAIDYDEGYLQQARFAAEVTGLDIEFAQLSVYDVGALGERFDLVLFLGVLYHLEDPLGAMRRVAALTRELAIIETAAIALGAEHEERPLWELYPADEFAGDPTNWWAPNLRAVHDLCRAAGFRRSQTIVGPRADGPAQYRAIVHAWM